MICAGFSAYFRRTPSVLQEKSTGLSTESVDSSWRCGVNYLRRPEYGGQFWVNGIGNWNLPRDAYFASGAGGQHTFVVPSHDLVIVRMGHQRGAPVGSKLLNQSLSAIVAAVESAR